MPNLAHTAASVSARWVNPPTGYLSTNSCMAGTSSWAATPTKVTPGLAAAVRPTAGASRWQLGHQGAQNHSTAGLPARLAPAKSAPSRVLALNCSWAGTCWAGALSAVAGAGADVVGAAAD